ncbi:hypothetical protein T4D_10541 [Trichinella pseudospiralis]|uniref:Uncharacterized protein n=1 Tax=Trichinella pseudospiralis TaxID=6337 RepID=A0A0V1F3E3_TRIPS|nr:hypothetical protein T4D_10541 [Trichinella pseudospiralis]
MAMSCFRASGFLDCYHLCEFPRVAFGNCVIYTNHDQTI